MCVFVFFCSLSLSGGWGVGGGGSDSNRRERERRKRRKTQGDTAEQDGLSGHRGDTNEILYTPNGRERFAPRAFLASVSQQRLWTTSRGNQATRADFNPNLKILMPGYWWAVRSLECAGGMEVGWWWGATLFCIIFVLLLVCVCVCVAGGVGGGGGGEYLCLSPTFSALRFLMGSNVSQFCCFSHC